MCIRFGSYSCNLDDIRKFTSEKFTEVLMDISVRVEAVHQIAVISFYVGLNKILQDPTWYEVRVRFSCVMHNGKATNAAQFDGLWQLAKSRARTLGLLLPGIQQSRLCRTWCSRQHSQVIAPEFWGQ
jgi:hypothetical protein